MKTWRLWWTDALVCLPLVLLVVICVYVYWEVVPSFEGAEVRRVESHYREVARSVRDREVSGIREYAGRERKSVGRLSRGSWGWERRGEKVLVWYRAPKDERVRGVVVEPMIVRDIGGMVVGWMVVMVSVVGLVTDIGLRRFRALAREREDFMAAVSHDLKTPLASLPLLIAGENEEALAVVERMRNLVANLNDFLRHGSLPRPQPEIFDLAEAFSIAYLSFQRDFDDGNFGPISISAPPTLVYADRQLTIRIFWNLLANALKYAAPYGKVYFRLTSSGTAQLIDEGHGLSLFERLRAFQHTYRANNPTTHCQGGFGIGLTNARTFARMMGGNLTLTRNHPHGCIFTLTLPTPKL